MGISLNDDNKFMKFNMYKNIYFSSRSSRYRIMDLIIEIARSVLCCHHQDKLSANYCKKEEVREERRADV